MKKLILAFVYLLFSLSGNAQKQNFGIFYNQNFSHQLHFNPSDVEWGSNVTGPLVRFGIGAFFERKIKNQFYLQSRIGYQQKGAFEERDVPVIDGGPPPAVIPEDNVFKFNYLAFELNGVQHAFTDFKVSPYFLGGLSYHYLLDFSYNLDGTINNGTFEDVPVARFETSKRHSFGAQVGGGIQAMKILRLDLRTQLDLNHFIDDKDLRVRHWLWAINAEVNINQLIKKLK